MACCSHSCCSVPHIRGDEPVRVTELGLSRLCSPHLWAATQSGDLRGASLSVAVDDEDKVTVTINEVVP